MRKLFLFFLLSGTLFATEYAPWFTSPWEIQSSGMYAYNRQNKIESPEGSFTSHSNNHMFHFSLGLTPWPSWNVETELYFAHTSNIYFAYEAFLITGRYQWLDELTGSDLVNLVTGITLSLPGERFLHEFSFPYHGQINAELHTSIGKEISWRAFDWSMRAWALGGIGIANRGSPWIHGIGAWEWKHNHCFQTSFLIDLLFGLGENNILEEEPFPGYASIDHRSIDFAVEIKYLLETLGTLAIEGWYNIYARNYPERYYGASIRLIVPFSL